MDNIREIYPIPRWSRIPQYVHLLHTYSCTQLSATLIKSSTEMQSCHFVQPITKISRNKQNRWRSSSLKFDQSWNFQIVPRCKSAPHLHLGSWGAVFRCINHLTYIQSQILNHIRCCYPVTLEKPDSLYWVDKSGLTCFIYLPHGQVEFEKKHFLKSAQPVNIDIHHLYHPLYFLE